MSWQFSGQLAVSGKQSLSLSVSITADCQLSTEIGTLGGIRTPDHQLRRLLLCPLSYEGIRYKSYSNQQARQRQMAAYMI